LLPHARRKWKEEQSRALLEFLSEKTNLREKEIIHQILILKIERIVKKYSPILNNLGPSVKTV
jgi:hypothetical protein